MPLVSAHVPCSPSVRRDLVELDWTEQIKIQEYYSTPGHRDDHALQSKGPMFLAEFYGSFKGAGIDNELHSLSLDASSPTLPLARLFPTTLLHRLLLLLFPPPTMTSYPLRSILFAADRSPPKRRIIEGRKDFACTVARVSTSPRPAPTTRSQKLLQEKPRQ